MVEDRPISFGAEYLLPLPVIFWRKLTLAAVARSLCDSWASVKCVLIVTAWYHPSLETERLSAVYRFNYYIVLHCRFLEGLRTTFQHWTAEQLLSEQVQTPVTSLHWSVQLACTLRTKPTGRAVRYGRRSVRRHYALLVCLSVCYTVHHAAPHCCRGRKFAPRISPLSKHAGWRAAARSGGRRQLFPRNP